MVRKLTLIKPEVRFPVKKQGYAGDVGMPTGLLSLAAYVRDRNGYDVSIADHRLNRALGKPVKTEVDIDDADVIGVGACTAEAPGALEIMRRAKEMGKTTIMGGLYPTFNATTVLQTGFVDFVVNGEGEAGLSNLLDAIDGKKDLTFLNNLIIYLAFNSLCVGPRVG